MSLIDDYNKGEIDAVELNRLLAKKEIERKQSRYTSMIVTIVFVCIGVSVFSYINHKSNISQVCQDKYPVYVNDRQVDIDAKLVLQELCREGKD